MEFWGVEVKPGEPLKVKPEVFRLIHISQAALGEVKDGKWPKCVPIHLKVGDKKYVMGTLSAEDRPQLMFDLVFEREFELSHDWKDGSIYFAGYIADDDSSELESHSDGEDFSDEDEQEENQVDELQNAKLEPNVGPKSATNKAFPAEPKPLEKSILKKVELKKDKTESNEDDDEGEEISEMEEDSSDASADTDSEDSDDENQDMASQKTKSGKKRPPETATEMLVPVAAKKTKSAAPQISGGKSPSANGKSGSQVSGKSCSKTFNSKNALKSRAKAKHGGK